MVAIRFEGGFQRSIYGKTVTDHSVYVTSTLDDTLLIAYISSPSFQLMFNLYTQWTLEKSAV